MDSSSFHDTNTTGRLERECYKDLIPLHQMQDRRNETEEGQRIVVDS